MAAVEVHDAPEEERYEAAVDGALAGFAEYRQTPGLIAFVHTEVDDAFEHQGVGSILIHDALEDARQRGLDVLPFCPFVNSYIQQHRDYVDLVPESRREALACEEDLCRKGSGCQLRSGGLHPLEQLRPRTTRGLRHKAQALDRARRRPS